MSDWVMPAALAQPLPRKVAMNGCVGGAFIIFSMIAGVIVLLIVVIAAASAHTTSVLEQRGVEITGKIFSHRIGQKKNERLYFIEYRFEPPELARQPVTFEGNEVQISAAQYEATPVGSPIAVIYDPQRPDRSMPLESFNRVKGHSAWRLVGIVCALIGGPVLVVVGLYGFYYRREKRILQWGKAVPARIVGEHTTQTRSGPVAKVTYSFEDDRGVTRQSMKTLPASNDLRPDFAEERARYLNNPTVVFGPGNSKRHVLFPGTLLQVN